jgi:hypothetical protein
MTSEKRKKVVLSIEQQPEALKKLDKGEYMQKFASKLSVRRVESGD